MSTPKTTGTRFTLALLPVVIVAITALALAACGGTDTASLPTPTAGGTIAFFADWTHQNPEKGNISVVGTDGSGLRRVIKDPNGVGLPAWSPDGRWIAYTVGGGDAPGVAVAKADGSDARRLHLGKFGGENPSWSPDGTRLAYNSWWWPPHEFPPAHIFVCDPDGSHRRQLTDGPDYDHLPVWTPDGQTILFRRVKEWGERPVPGDVYSVRPDGSGLTRVTRTGMVTGFALSPDGSQLAVHDDATDGIVLLPYGTGGPPKTILDLTDFGWPMVHLSWSPDGKALVLGRSTDNAYFPDELLVVNADGSGLSEIPGVKGSDPDWRPE